MSLPLDHPDHDTIQSLWGVWLDALELAYGVEAFNSIGFEPNEGQTDFFVELADGCHARMRLDHELEPGKELAEFLASDIRFIIEAQRGAR